MTRQRHVDMTGKRCGNVVVLGRAGKYLYKKPNSTIGYDGPATWLVRCDCGVERVIIGQELRRKPSKTHRACERIKRIGPL